jgi:fluoride exporter
VSASLFIVAAACGALGCVARFVVDSAVRARWTSNAPVGTMLVNVTGSLLFGLVAGFATRNSHAVTAAVIVGTGFCGGLTTFSAISFETTRLAQAHKWALALAVPVATAALSLTMAIVGIWFGSGS